MFFLGGEVTQSVLFSLSEEDVLRKGGRAERRLDGQFASVSSDVDWMAGTPFTIRELFTRIVPLPNVANNHRNEVLIGATCAGWLTASGDEVVAHNLTIGDVPPTLRSTLVAATRTLVWRFDPAYWMTLKIAAEGGSNDDYV